MSNADFFKTYFDQVWREMKIFYTQRILIWVFKPNFQFLMWNVNIIKLINKYFLSN